MLTVVTDRVEIARCQEKFEENLRRNLPVHEKRDVGYQGGMERDMQIYADRPNGGFWFGTKPIDKPKHWNAFGFLKEKGSLNITVEINVQHESIDNRVQGLFAKDAKTGKHFVLHRGTKINGFTKEEFRNLYDGVYKEVEQGFEAILVADVDDPFDAVRRFVERVGDCRKAKKAGKLINPPKTDKSLIGFRPEFAGIKSGKRNAEFEYETYHGVVVDELRQHVSEIESGREEFNTQFIDLGFHRGEKIASLYEVKTACNRQSIYTGIGQLMVHSAGDETVKKTLVMPEPDKLGAEIYNTLQALGINLLYYKYCKRKGPRVEFYPR